MKSKVILMVFFVILKFILISPKNINAQYPLIYSNPLIYSYLGYSPYYHFYDSRTLADIYTIKADLSFLELFLPKSLSDYIYQYDYHFLPNTYLLPNNNLFLGYMSDIYQSWINTLPREWVDADLVYDPQTGVSFYQAPVTPWGRGIPGMAYLAQF